GDGLYAVRVCVEGGGRLRHLAICQPYARVLRNAADVALGEVLGHRACSFLRKASLGAVSGKRGSKASGRRKRDWTIIADPVAEETPKVARIARAFRMPGVRRRSEEHTSELQSRFDLVCR